MSYEEAEYMFLHETKWNRSKHTPRPPNSLEPVEDSTDPRSVYNEYALNLIYEELFLKMEDELEQQKTVEERVSMKSKGIDY
jgi:hypothetical protein